MTIPTKKEFQELIDFCNKDRLPKQLDIWPSQAKEHVKSILHEFINKRESALKEMETLPAFYWLKDKNGNLFSTAMNIIYPEKVTDFDIWVEQNTHDITCRTETTLNDLYTNPEIASWDANIGFDRLKESLENITQCAANKVQRYERIIAIISGCFMSFIYPDPTKKLEPKVFRKNTSNLIKKLEEAQKIEDQITRYDDVLYLSSVGDNYLQYKLDLYKAFLSDKKLLPANKSSDDKTPVRMFIVSITRALLLNTAPFKHRDKKKRLKEIQDFTVNLVQILSINPDLGGLSIDEKNTKGIVSSEIQRHNKISALRKEIADRTLNYHKIS